jgi:NADP-dependent 3-hydroxy acid dehydrogenase YdfG
MNIIITGASRGIGRGIAEVLSQQGHTLGLVSRSEDDLIVTKEHVKHPEKTFIQSCDIQHADKTRISIDTLTERMGSLDVLINNAGLVLRKGVFDISPEEWQSVFATNVHGLFFATQAALIHMRKQQSGHIINISSISGRLPLPGGSAYAASKFAITGFSESLFQEVRDLGINVSTIFPGSVNNGSNESEDWKLDPKEIGEACAQCLSYRSQVCVSRLEIRPSRVSR